MKKKMDYLDFFARTETTKLDVMKSTREYLMSYKAEYKAINTETKFHYKEIESIINDLKDNEGCISKLEFEERIEQLTEYKPEHKPSISNKGIIINDITKYQNKAKLKGFDSSYKKFIKIQLNKLGLEKTDFREVKLNLEIPEKIRFLHKDDIEPHCVKVFEFFEYNFVSSLNELTEILNVSRPTVNRWEKLGIQTKQKIKATIVIKGQIYHLFKNNWFAFYDLGAIKQGLRELK